MNAMLDPRMVAVSIQIFASAPHGTPSPADRIMASSQGAFMPSYRCKWLTYEKHDFVDRLLVGGHSQELPARSEQETPRPWPAAYGPDFTRMDRQVCFHAAGVACNQR